MGRINHNPPKSRVWKIKVGDYLDLSSGHFLKKLQPERGGVIMIKDNASNKDGLLFGFGRDTKTREVTDFAGHSKHTDSNIVYTALREFKEETLWIFDVSMDVLRSCNMYICRTDAVIMLPVSFSTQEMSVEYNKRFLHYVNNGRRTEVSELLWFRERQITHVMKHRRFYKRVENMLSGCGKPRDWIAPIQNTPHVNLKRRI